MIAMSCAAFESALCEILAAGGAAGADPRLPALAEHARTCAACRGAADLVALAASPVDARDPVADPGPAYWSAFDARLAARLASTPSPRRRPVARHAAWAAAAAAGLALLFLFVRPEPAPSGGSGTATPAVAPPVDEAIDPDDDLARSLADLDAAAPFGEEADAPLFPEPKDLTADEEERLLDWLTEEEARIQGGPA